MQQNVSERKPARGQDVGSYPCERVKRAKLDGFVTLYRKENP
jgi:hypothetical protein